MYSGRGSRGKVLVSWTSYGRYTLPTTHSYKFTRVSLASFDPSQRIMPWGKSYNSRKNKIRGLTIGSLEDSYFFIANSYSFLFYSFLFIDLQL